MLRILFVRIQYYDNLAVVILPRIYMKLYYYKDAIGNFGDDLNPIIFNRYFPDLIDGTAFHGEGIKNYGDSDDLLVGIGTLLNHWIPDKNRKLIFSTGAGYGISKVLENSEVFCVRGPLTAKKLNLDPSKAITDGAALLSRMGYPTVPKRFKYSFIPHYSTAINGDWNWVCSMLGVNYIDPCGKAEEIITQISETDTVLAEAMHGAIVADSLRVPWVPVKTSSEILDFKWNDWASGLDMVIEFGTMPSVWKASNIFGRLRSGAKKLVALKRMQAILRTEASMLSRDSTFKDRVDRLEEAAYLLRSKYRTR